jgi:hypothetical protein
MPHFPEFTDEGLSFTPDEAGIYCAMVRKRLNAPRLTRPFNLRCLISLRKQRKRRAAKAEQVTA